MMRKLNLSSGKMILLITLLLNFAFIFVHASFPPSVSGAEIDAVGGAVSEILPESTSFGAFLQRNISNIAHFCEYGALGVQIMIAVMLWAEKKVRVAAISPLFALAVAFLDESVQILSGRHSSILDIWMDIIGFTVCMLLTLGIFCVTRIIKNKSKQRR